MDRYTKIILTIIAVALTAIAVEQAAPRAFALGDACGSIREPCYIATPFLAALPVTITNNDLLHPLYVARGGL